MHFPHFFYTLGTPHKGVPFQQPDSITLWSRRRPAAAEGQSTGLSHLIGSSLISITNKMRHPQGVPHFVRAGNRTRTGTLLRARDFKSLVSTDFTMPAR